MRGYRRFTQLVLSDDMDWVVAELYRLASSAAMSCVQIEDAEGFAECMQVLSSLPENYRERCLRVLQDLRSKAQTKR